IDRVHFERLDGVLVESGDKNERRRLVITLQQPASDLKTRQAGHLDVQKDKIRLMPLDRGNRLEAIGRLGDDFRRSELPQLVAKLLASKLLVVDDDNPHSSWLVVDGWWPAARLWALCPRSTANHQLPTTNQVMPLSARPPSAPESRCGREYPCRARLRARGG